MTNMLNPLGNPTDYPAAYDASLLFPIPRSQNRQRLAVDDDKLPFRGYDMWRAYEMSWLNTRGKPVVAVGEFLIPAASPNMVESKSFKLYLNSLNQERYENMEQVQELIARDVSRVTGSTVLVQLYSLQASEELQCAAPEGRSLDDLDIAIDAFSPDATLLAVEQQGRVEESLYSNLFRSNCPVTTQPDWGTVSIKYRGPALNHESLLRYLVSYRSHNGFHEDCVEQIYLDIMARAAPEQLSVAINFLRRGGLEINPVRTSSPASVEFPASRLLRQ
jgi:7-cyano-7-deazaguanine reductase